MWGNLVSSMGKNKTKKTVVWSLTIERDEGSGKWGGRWCSAITKSIFRFEEILKPFNSASSSYDLWRNCILGFGIVPDMIQKYYGRYFCWLRIGLNYIFPQVVSWQMSFLNNYYPLGTIQKKSQIQGMVKGKVSRSWDFFHTYRT